MDEKPPELATETVTLKASPELLTQLMEGWSPPVQVRVIRTPGVGTGWEMEAREVRP
jgi:hypothetical protein